MANNRKRKKRLLVEFGFTAEEVQATEDLAAKLDLNTLQVIRGALRLYQAREAGLVKCEWRDDPVGCPAFD